jgi:hypothetical protein
MGIPSNGTTELFSDAELRFDQQTAQIPNEINSDAPEPEIIPPGQESAAEAGWPIWDVQQILTLPFFFLERRFGDLWELDEKESAYLAKGWKPILDKYLPLEETELGTALLVTLAVLGPRIMMTDWNKKPEKKAAEEKKSTQQASTKTAASTGSPSTSGNGSPVNPAEWDLLSDK